VHSTVQIKTHHFLKRDIESKAIINTDQSTQRALRDKRNNGIMEMAERRRHGKEIENLNSLVGEIKRDMTEIKESLMMIAGRV